MVARMKSRVLVREEKAFATVTMKRIMICGMGAGVSYYTAQFLVPICSLPTLIVAFMAMLYATGNRYGVSRFRWIIDGWRGRLLINARRQSTGVSTKICSGFGWDASVVVVNGSKLYVSKSHVDDDWSGIQIMDSDDPDAGGFEVLGDG
jgi:hypothetical protein